MKRTSSIYNFIWFDISALYWLDIGQTYLSYETGTTEDIFFLNNWNFEYSF